METVLNHPLFMPIVVTVVIIAAFPLVAGYIVLVERKVLADFQVRLGPMRVGPHGLLQPIADALKLLLKEDIIPTDADKALFWFAPCISTITALSAFAVVPFAKNVYVADVNVGLLVVSAMSAVGILGIILGGWSSNSHYPLLGALRSAAQLVSYEVALAFALLSGVMVAGTLSMRGIVQSQIDRGVWGIFGNYGFMIVPFALYIIAATASPRRTARPSTCPRPKASWSPASTPNTAASAGRSTSWRSTPTFSSLPRSPWSSSGAAGFARFRASAGWKSR